MRPPLTRSSVPSIEFHSMRPAEPFTSCESRWRYIPQETNSDSLYADDDPSALMDGVYNEQAARHIAIRALEAGLVGPVSPKTAERLHKELTFLRTVYRAQWDELESAVGREACEEVGHSVAANGRTEMEPASRQADQYCLPL